MEEIEVEDLECFKKLDLSIRTDVGNTPIDHSNDALRFQSESDYDIFIEQISSEIPLQRLVAAKRIVKSCESWDTEVVLSILPQLKQLSFDKEMIIRQTTAEALGAYCNTCASDDEASVQVIIHDILPLIKEMLKDSMEVRQGAIASLISIAGSEVLQKEQMHQHIVKVACDMSAHDSHDHKITALHLFGELAPIIGSHGCKEYLCDKLKRLSRDSSFRVKKMATQQFGAICKELSVADTERRLLPIFMTLCNDSIWSVRNVCAECLIDISGSISDKSRDGLIDIMMKLLNDSSRWVRNTAYQHLGPFISSLSSEQVSADLLSYFTSIPHLSSVIANADCTNHCAFNFPAVALTVGKDRWDELHETYAILCRKSIKCRKTLACSVHEIAGILGTELTEKYLLQSIELFLRDVDEIRSGMIRNLSKLLSVFSDKLRTEYISTLWQLASEPDSNWRFRLFLSQQFDQILRLYSLNQVKQQIVPLIFTLCQDRMADVRYAAVAPIADAINVLSAGNGEDDDEEDLQCVTKTIETLYSARTYSKRLLYIRIADACFGRIDPQLFDNIFIKNLLHYANDKIVNVRFCLARFIHKHLLQNERYKEHDAIQKAIDRLKNDEEDDVETKRFFMSADEIENWLQQRNDERAAQQLVLQNENDGTNSTKQPNTADADGTNTDSSVYSTSDAEDGPLGTDNGNRWIVMDSGSYLIKAGFEGEKVPRVIRPSCMNTGKDNNSENMKYVIQRGIITSIEDMECIWYDVLYNELKVDPAQCNILLSEATLNPKCNKEKMMQSMFETFDVQTIAIVNEAVLSFYASGLLTGVSCVVGDGVTQIVPISNGYALQHAMIRKDLGGMDVTKYLRQLLSSSTSAYLSSNPMEIEIVRDIKHTYSFVDCDGDHRTDGAPQYVLPDGTSIAIDSEVLSRCNEVLFEPKLMDMNGSGVHQLLHESFKQCDTDCRNEIWSDQQNYWITGGVTATPGFMQRIKKEMNLLVTAKNEDKLSAFHDKHAVTSTFVGGSILAGLVSYQDNITIDSHQYDEYGASVLYRK